MLAIKVRNTDLALKAATMSGWAHNVPQQGHYVEKHCIKVMLSTVAVLPSNKFEIHHEYPKIRYMGAKYSYFSVHDT